MNLEELYELLDGKVSDGKNHFVPGASVSRIDELILDSNLNCKVRTWQLTF